jgi:predicted acyl esterase
MIWFVIAARSPLGVSPTSGKETYEVTVEQNVAAEMRDAIALRASVYRPKAEGKLPILIVRTPYGKAGSNCELGFTAAGRCCLVINQECRERYASEGEWSAPRRR